MGHQLDLPNSLADSDIADGAQPFHQVCIWDGEHARRKFYKAYKDKKDAEITVTALRMHGLDAELVTVGDPGARGT